MWRTKSDHPPPPPSGPPGEPTVASAVLADGSERYVPLLLLGRGGMGEVWRVEDRLLRRIVAQKRVRSMGSDGVSRFLAEARLVGRLQHPGVVPVHDLGRLPDGRVFFTMPEVQGRTFTDLILEVHGGPPEERRRGLRRLVEVFARVAATVAYAHDQGFLHGDLKPGNLMVGAYGEAFVLDWGLARALDGSDGRVETGGTPGFMSPEQAWGRPLDARADVYALGAVLFAILSGRPPYVMASLEAVRAITEPPQCPSWLWPPDLVELSLRALSLPPDARPPTAGALGGEVEEWLEGARERDRARKLVNHARELAPQLSALSVEAARIRREVAAASEHVASWAPVEEKAPLWESEDRARALDERRAFVEVEYTQTLRAALGHAPDLPEAHRLLADLYRRRHEDAERRGELDAATRYEALLRAHDPGNEHGPYLAGEGWLTLDTSPEGAEVELYRYTLEGRRLLPRALPSPGRTPLWRVPLPHGSYLLVLRAPGCAPVHYPVAIGRGRTWPTWRPVDDTATPTSQPIPLPPRDALGPDDVYVPGGWFRSGDPEARLGLERRDVWVDGFVIRRFPVTHGEYLAFLNDLVARGEDALRHAPRLPGGKGEGKQRYPRDSEGRFLVGPDPEGDTPELTMPVMAVSWDDARAYAAWYAARTGLRWRLPYELEREKAVRGVDGRLYPWGDMAEPTWSCNAQARPGRALPASVDSFPVDESPYGVRGGAGNIRDRCLDAGRPEGPRVSDTGRMERPDPTLDPPDSWRVERGGTWNAGIAYGRCGFRLRSPREHRSGIVGFRLARDWP